MRKVGFFVFLMMPGFVWSFQNEALSLGVGYYSQNVMNKTAVNPAGKTSFLGETSLPLNIKYDFSIFSDWFLAPQLSYTIVPRESEGASAKITMTHLAFLFGKNFQGSSWDWYMGPGILQQDFDGKGGTVQLLNGSTPTTFYLPSGKSTTRKVSVNIGSSYSFLSTRLGFDLILENAFSSNKRSESLMFSYAYTFGEGSSGGGRSRIRSRPRGGMLR